MISNYNIYIIVNCQRQDYYLLFIDFAKPINFDIIDKKNLIKYKKNNIKKINYNYATVYK